MAQLEPFAVRPCFFEGKRAPQLSKLHANYNNMSESPIYLSVRSISELIAPPRYYSKGKCQQALDDAYRRCHVSEMPTESAIENPLAKYLWENQKEELIECFDAAMSNEKVFECFRHWPISKGFGATWTPFIDKFCTAINLLRGRYNEQIVRKRGNVEPGECITFDGLAPLYIRGKTDGTTHTGNPVEIKVRSKKMYDKIPLNEYIQCQLYARITNKQWCRFYQEFQGEIRMATVIFDDVFFEELLDLIRAIERCFRRCDAEDMSPSLAGMPGLGCSKPDFIEDTWFDV